MLFIVKMPLVRWHTHVAPNVSYEIQHFCDSWMFEIDQNLMLVDLNDIAQIMSD